VSEGTGAGHATITAMKKEDVSAVMRHLNKHRNRKYGKAWREGPLQPVGSAERRDIFGAYTQLPACPGRLNGFSPCYWMVRAVLADEGALPCRTHEPKSRRP
jgi:hypothetical protein